MTLVVILTNHNFILRSGSLSNIPDQRSRTAHWSAPRRTPPITGGRLNPIGGSKFSGPAYQHLQEVDSSEQEADAQRGWGEFRLNKYTFYESESLVNSQKASLWDIMFIFRNQFPSAVLVKKKKRQKIQRQKHTKKAVLCVITY